MPQDGVGCPFHCDGLSLKDKRCQIRSLKTAFALVRDWLTFSILRSAITQPVPKNAERRFVMVFPSIQIYLLGRFEVVHDQHILKAGDWSRRKAAMLLQYLTLERRLIKDRVIEALCRNLPRGGRKQPLSDPSQLAPDSGHLTRRRLCRIGAQFSRRGF